MLDNQLITLTIQAIIAGESAAGIPGTPIKQAFQPTAQGANTQPTAYMFKVGDRRIGSPLRTNIWDESRSAMVHTEEQQYETTFQISSLVKQNPATPTQMTASDVVNLIAYILQSEATITFLLANNIGILRIMDVRNPYFKDDFQRNEASPSFDFILTHKQIISTLTPGTKTTVLQVFTV